jgi:mycothiol synthase
MQNPIELTPIDPATMAPELWARYHAFRHARHQQLRPDDPILPDAMAERLMKRPDPFFEERRYIVLDGQRIVGTLYADWWLPTAPGYESNRAHLGATGVTLTEARRQGIGTAFARAVLGLMEAADKTVLTVRTEEADGHAFMQWLGMAERSVGAENRLDLTAVDWDMVDRWVREGPARSPATELVFYEHRVPDAELEAFSPMLGELLNTMPFDDLDHGKIVVTADMMRDQYQRLDDLDAAHHTYLTKEPDGTISGMTDVQYVPVQPDRVDQRFTGVRPDCRGRGIGKWIKAAMLQYIHQTYPDARWITTSNANSNDPMLHINQALGFKTYKGASTYQIERDALAARLAQL